MIWHKNSRPDLRAVVDMRLNKTAIPRLKSLTVKIAYIKFVPTFNDSVICNHFCNWWINIFLLYSLRTAIILLKWALLEPLGAQIAFCNDFINVATSCIVSRYTWVWYTICLIAKLVWALEIRHHSSVGIHSYHIMSIITSLALLFIPTLRNVATH